MNNELACIVIVVLLLCAVSMYNNRSCAVVVWPSLWRDGEALLSFAISVMHCIFSCYRSQIQVSHSHLVLMVPCSTNSNISDNTFLLKYSYCTCRKAFFTDLPPMRLSNRVLQTHIKSEITFNFPCWRTRIDF